MHSNDVAMKNTPLLTVLLMLASALGLQAQSSSILIKTGDEINGTSTNPATIRSLANVTMNDAGGIAFQGFATEGISVTNKVQVTNISYATNFIPTTNIIRTITATNIVPRTITNITYQYTNVVVNNVVINYSGTVTNVLYVTNRWLVNGTTNTYVNKYAQILYFPNSPGTFTNVYNILQGRALTNTYTTNVTQYSYQTNYVPTNRMVLTPTGTNVTTNNRVTTNFTTSYSGLWASDTNGSVNLMIRSGEPSGISNSSINSFFNTSLNNNGAVAFIGYSTVTNSVTSTNGIISNSLSNVTSIYLIQQGSTNPVRVASQGEPAPGLSGNYTSFGNLVLPDVGGVIFMGWSGTNQGIWVQNPDTSVRLVALRGQSISVGSTNKVISSFSLMNRYHSQDTGIITYQAYFTDGTSAIIRVNR